MDYLMKNPPADLVNTNEAINIRIVNFVGKYGLKPNLLIIDSATNNTLLKDKLNYRVSNGKRYYRGMLVKISIDKGLFVSLY